MDRLTRREHDGDALPREMFDHDSAVGCVTWCSMYQHGMCNKCPVSEAFNKLADYEDAEEVGQFIKLPLKYGDHIYEAYENMHKVLEWTVNGFSITPDSMYISIGKFGLSINAAKIGDTLFYTREEAEAKLKEMEDDNGNS